MTAPRPGAGFQAEVYSYDNPTGLPIEILPRRQGLTSLEEIKNVGGGSVIVSKNDPNVQAFPALLDYQNLVKIRHDGRVIGSFITQNKKNVVVSAGERREESVLLSGEGIRAWLRQAVVHPYGGLRADSATSRRFSFTSERGSWYKTADWINASNSQKYNMDPNDGPWNTAPAYWPDVPEVWWIWGTPLVLNEQGKYGNPAGWCYFRYEFTVPAGTSGRHSLFAAADNFGRVYLDGEQIIEINEWSNTMRSDFTLAPGDHVLAFEVENQDFAVPSNPGGLIAALFRDNILLTATGGLDDVHWKVNAYPNQAPGWTPGEIMMTLLGEAEARGVRFPTWIVPTFTETTDSNGQPWGATLDWVFDIGTELIDVVSQLEEVGVDIWFDPDTFEMHMAPTRGAEKSVQTATTEPVTLRIGRNLTLAEQEGKSDLKNTLAVRTDTGWVIQDDLGTSQSTYGRVEGLLSTGMSLPLSRMVSKAVFDQKALPWTSSTYSLVPVPGAVPYEDFTVGDWILAPNGDGLLERVRVLSLATSESATTGSPDYAIEFGTIAEDLEDRYNRWLRTLNKGSMSGSIANTSPVTTGPPAQGTPADEGTDSRSPLAPAGFDAYSISYIDANGNPRGKIVASWQAVTTATDGTLMTIADYELALRTNITDAPWWIATRSDDLAVEYADLEPGQEIYARVRARARYGGNPGVWSAAVLVTVARDTTPPPVPSSPVVTSRLGVLTVAWDGETSTAGPLPIDFRYVQVDMSSAAFANATPVNIIQLFAGAGAVNVTDQPYGQMRYFRLRSVDQAGNTSNWSATGSAATAALVDTDLMGTTLADQFEALETQISDIDLTAAEGRVTTSPNAPVTADATGKTDGALWYRYTNDAMVGAWRLQGGTWISFPLDRTFIPSLDIGTGTFGTLDGVRIKAHTVQADALLIGDFTNLVDDPLLIGPGWQKGTSPAQSSIISSPTLPGLAWEFISNGTQVFIENRNVVPVVPGDNFRMSFKGYNTANLPGFMRLSFFKQDDTSAGFSDLAVPVGTASWTSFAADAVVPVDAARMRIRFLIGTTSTSGRYYFAAPVVRRKFGTTLIENGAITTGQIGALAIKAGQIDANAVTTNTIAAGAVKTEQLDAFAITAKHTITGATLQTSALANTGIKINSALGISAYNDANSRTFYVGPAGDVEMAGTLRTGIGVGQIIISQEVLHGRPGVMFYTGGVVWADGTEPLIQSIGLDENFGYVTGSLVIGGREQVRNNTGRADITLEPGGDWSITQNWGIYSNTGIEKNGKYIDIRGALGGDTGANYMITRYLTPVTQQGAGFMNLVYGTPAASGVRRPQITPEGIAAVKVGYRDVNASSLVINFDGNANNNTAFFVLSIWEG